MYKSRFDLTIEVDYNGNSYLLSSQRMKLWKFDENNATIGFQCLGDLYNMDHMLPINNESELLEFLPAHLEGFNYFTKSVNDWDQYLESLPE